jgi:hypothetical protein
MVGMKPTLQNRRGSEFFNRIDPKQILAAGVKHTLRLFG